MIAFDASSSGSALTGSSITFAHTCSGSNRILIVFITSNNNDVITGVTYDGISMTLGKKSTFTSPTLYFYYLLNPTTGSNNIVVSASTGTEFLRATAVSYTGVKQSGQPDATAEASVSSTSITTSLTQNVANAWQVGGVQGQYNGNVTAGAGVGAIRASMAYNYLGDSNATTSAGTQSMTWNQGGSAGMRALQFSLADIDLLKGGVFLHNWL